MANAAVAGWTACIKELQQQLGATGPVRADDFSAFSKRVTALEQQLPLPHAAWKRLVQDVQVKHADVLGCQAGFACAAPITMSAGASTSM
jgi:hypothetical protein